MAGDRTVIRNGVVFDSPAAALVGERRRGEPLEG